MSAEDQEMMAKISELAGRINRRKNERAGLISASSHDYPQPSSWHHRHGSFRVAKAAPHRHRTLILNGKAEVESGATSDASSSSWVTKNDRHLQLINMAVYEKEVGMRSKAIEQTRLQKQQQRDGLERFKVLRHLGRIAHRETGSTNGAPAARYTVVVEGIPFYVTKNGSKLVKAPGDNDRPSATPKTAVIGGVKFYRSKTGNLYRHGIVKAQLQSGAVKKTDQPCKAFSTTGSCPKGPRCRYLHNPSRVAACKDLLQKGECADGDACDMSHELAPERAPHCLHFAKDNCTNPNCRYAHVKVSAGALVCQSFGMYGYCEKGGQCAQRHVYECPDFSNTGVCKTKGCKLLHRERASVLRKATSNSLGGGSNDDEMADVSSDEDGESADSDDVDSDAVDEFFGDDDVPDVDFATQRDFIEL